MKHAFLKFSGEKYAVPFTPKRRMYMHQNRGGVQFNGGSGGSNPTETEEEKEAKRKFLENIKTQVSTEVQSKGYKNEAEIKNMITLALQGLDVEAIKKFKFEEIAASVKNIAGALEKVQQQSASGNGNGNKLNMLKKVLGDKKFLDMVEGMFNAKNGNMRLDVKQAAVIMTTGNVVDDGNIPEDILNSFSVEGFVKKRRPVEYIYDVISRRTVAKIKEYKTWLEEGDEEGAFAIVAQGGLKPLISKKLVRNTAKYRKAAGKKVYTEEFVMFREEAFNIIEDLLNDKVMRDYANILQTDLLTWAAAYVGTTLDDQYETPTDYHAIGAVAAQIESLEFVPDLLLLNPQDKWRIGLQQATDGHFFVNIPTMTPSGMVQMLGFRVLTSTKITPGQFMLGESGLYKVEDTPMSVRLGYGLDVVKDGEGKVTDVESDVDHNRFRIIVEVFFHNWVATTHTGSFVKANFADVKAALLKPAV